MCRRIVAKRVDCSCSHYLITPNNRSLRHVFKKHYRQMGPRAMAAIPWLNVLWRDLRLLRATRLTESPNLAAAYHFERFQDCLLILGVLRMCSAVRAEIGPVRAKHEEEKRIFPACKMERYLFTTTPNICVCASYNLRVTPQLEAYFDCSTTGEKRGR